MTSDGEVLLHRYAVKCDVAPSKIIRIPTVMSPIVVDPWSKKIRSPNSPVRNPLTRDLSGLGLRQIAEWACLHHMLVKTINLSRYVQVSCPLLELRSGHVVVFQVRVPQISLIR